jgi:hypothetical protein
MTSEYAFRLLLLAGASFSILYLVLSAVVSLIAPLIVRMTEKMSARPAGAWLLILRLMPAGLSAIAVGALVAPSYLRFEPRWVEEEFGFLCLACAISGAGLFSTALYRAFDALIRTSSYIEQSTGRPERLGDRDVLIVPRSAGFALAGILRPRLLISERALAELTSDQLDLAMRHEQGHRVAHDNLKRLLLLVSPAIFPGVRSLELAWRKCAEWAADDYAAQGDADRSASLASALVKVARFQSAGLPPLVATLVEADEDLRHRVDRLLSARPASATPSRYMIAAICSSVSLIVFTAINPSAQRAVYSLLERLLD